MIGPPTSTRVWIVAGHTDMRKGFNSLSAMVQTALAANPFCGHVFVFRGRFVWPQAQSGKVSLTSAQLSMLLEGIDWRMPTRTDRPVLAA